MIENGIDIQTISTKRTDFQTDRVLLFGHVKEKIGKANPSHSLKFFFRQPHKRHIWFCPIHKPTIRKTKRAVFFLRTSFQLFKIKSYICPSKDKSVKGNKMLGEKLKELRESKGLLQRQVAAELDVDTAYISKMESNDKPVSKAYLSKLAHLYSVEEQELLTLWLADKVYDVVKDQDVVLKAMEVAEEEIKNKRKRKN